MPRNHDGPTQQAYLPRRSYAVMEFQPWCDDDHPVDLPQPQTSLGVNGIHSQIRVEAAAPNETRNMPEGATLDDLVSLLETGFTRLRGPGGIRHRAAGISNILGRDSTNGHTLSKEILGQFDETL